MRWDGRSLARRFLEGRADAVGTIERWVRSAAGPFRRRLGDEWKDAVQESLLEVTEALQKGRIRNPDRLRAWVFRATAHTCLDRLRARTRRSWVDADEAFLASPPSALGRLLEEGSVSSLLEVVRRCPEHCLHLWRMILEGLSYRQMSERTGLAEGTLRVRVLRCRRRALELAAGEELHPRSDRPVTKRRLERRKKVRGDDHGL